MEIFYSNIIPVRIIKRIEVIKGSASSTWGSALGGVINIITKDTGKEERPQLRMVGSSAEYSTHDLTAEVSGKAGRVGYYLYAGDQDSDGIGDGRHFRNSSGYSKLRIQLPEKMYLELSGLYSRPAYLSKYFPASDTEKELDDENYFYSARLDAPLSDRLNMHWEASRFINNYSGHQRTISSGGNQDQYENNQKTTALSNRFDLTTTNHTLVAGFDYRHTEVDFNYLYRTWNSWAFSSLPSSYHNPLLEDDVLGIFLNDTYRRGNWTMTPGIRFDHLSSVAGEQLNPSFGITYRARPDLLLRGIVSKGFRKAPLFYTNIDYAYSPWGWNPSLEAEENWSYQLGLETTALPYCHLKTTLFYHDIDNTWVADSDWLPFRMNGGNSQRIGGEIEVRTRPIFDTSVIANFTYVHTDAENNAKDDSANANLIFQYDNPDILTAELAGHWVNWGHINAPVGNSPKTNTYLWDLSINKNAYKTAHLSMDIFGVVRNIFNGSQYVDTDYNNSPRWIEAGIKIHF